MSPFFFPGGVRFLAATRSILACCLLLIGAGPAIAQSTFGSILGTVRDSSGANVQGAQITLVNAGTSSSRILISDSTGSFGFKNIDVGSYTLTVTATGFEKDSLPEIELTARETRRLDVVLKPGAEDQTVTVVDDPLPVITTDVSNVAETKTGTELVDLPVAIYSRSTGSTSPISTLTTEAGVQTDDSGELAVAGTTAALLSVTVDGISSVGVEYSGPVNEMFPSFNSIEEIRVSESNNSAEFGGVADITTVSKAGTNKLHGGLFENHENTILNSNNIFALSKPRIIMNDFGGTFGGPIQVPHLFNGRDSTFFFVSYEGLRLPRQTPIVLSVPSMDMRNGNISYYLNQTYCQPDPTTQCPNGYTVYNPDGSVLTNSITGPQVTPSAITTNLLNVLMPMPNLGSAGAFANNYQINFPSPISSNQGDVRLDHAFLAWSEVEAEGAGRRFAVEQRIDDDVLGHGVRRLDPEFAKERKLLLETRIGVDRQSARRQAVALAAAEKAEIARAEKRDHLVPDVGRVDRKAQPKAGEAEIDRQDVVDLGPAVVEEIGGVGDRRRDAVTQDVDDHRTLVEMPEMKQFEAEIGPVLAEQRLIGFEADVAPGVEIEVRQAVGQRGNRAVERRGGKVARPLDDVWEAERRRRSSRSLRRAGLGGRRRNNASARSGHEAAEQRPAGQIVHERHSGWAVRFEPRDMPARAKRRYGHGANGPLPGLVLTIASTPMLIFEVS